MKNNTLNGIRLYALYRTDSWLTYASREFIGIYSDLSKLVKGMMKNHATPNQIHEVCEQGQSQCNNTNYEFIYDEVTINQTEGLL